MDAPWRLYQPVLASLLVAVGAALSLVAIITIYTEGCFPSAIDVNLWRFTLALLVGTLSILSVGVVISGWQVLANLLPSTHAVALMQGISDGAMEA